MYGRVTGTGASHSPPLHPSVRENCRSFWFAVLLHVSLAVRRKSDFSVSLRIYINLYSWLSQSVREVYSSLKEVYGKCKGGIQKV